MTLVMRVCQELPFCKQTQAFNSEKVEIMEQGIIR